MLQKNYFSGQSLKKSKITTLIMQQSKSNDEYFYLKTVYGNVSANETEPKIHQKKFVGFTAMSVIVFIFIGENYRFSFVDASK